MSKAINSIRKRYDTLFREIEHELVALVDSIDIARMSKYNALYKSYAQDKFKCFVEMEKCRYYRALDLILSEKTSGKVADLGCLIPYLPAVLSKLGFNVVIADRYEFYGEAFKHSIEKFANHYGIEIRDMDILNDDYAKLGPKDIILNMAVVEHLNGSPRNLLKSIHGAIAPNGFLIFDVPNIAEFTKRVRLFLGDSPLEGYHIYFNSPYPFIGHNREMTKAEVEYMLEHSEFSIDYIECYDFNPHLVRTFKGKLALCVKKIVPLKNKEGSIIAKAKPRLAHKS